MNSKIIAIGTSTAPDFRESSHSVAISGTPPVTVGELLNHVKGQLPDQTLKLLRTTVGHVAAFLQFSGNQLTLTVDALQDLDPKFSMYLADRRYCRHTIHIYRYGVRVLLRNAEQIGWRPQTDDVVDTWTPITQAITVRCPSALRLVRFAIAQRKLPAAITLSEFELLGREMVSQGKCYATFLHLVKLFRRAIRESGLESLVPNISCEIRPRRYGVGIEKMPEQLRSEIQALLKWKQAPYAPGRSQSGRLRPVSADILREYLECVYGFAVNVNRQQNINSLAALVSKEILSSYIEWQLNEKEVQGSSLLSRLGLLKAAVVSYPRLKGGDFDWIKELSRSIPIEPDTARLERKSRKYVPYDQLAEIPRRIREGNNYESEKR